MQILAATDFSTRSNRAVRQAGLMARSTGAGLSIVHVVDDDQPDNLIQLETREAMTLLQEQVSTMPELQDVECRPMVVSGDPHDGILRTSAASSADLVVMGSHRKQLLKDVFVGTTVERVIRAGPFPVLMVRNEAQESYRNVVAAIDLTDRSAKALRVARNLGLVTDDNKLTVLHAFAPAGTAMLSNVGVERQSIDDYVAIEREKSRQSLLAFLQPEIDVRRAVLSVQQGSPIEVISEFAAKKMPDLIVMGTQGRHPIIKALFGSVTAEVLRILEVDVLAVPTSATTEQPV